MWGVRALGGFSFSRAGQGCWGDTGPGDLHAYSTPAIRSTFRNDSIWWPSASTQIAHQLQPSHRLWMNPSARNRAMTRCWSRRDVGISVWRHGPLSLLMNPDNVPPFRAVSGSRSPKCKGEGDPSAGGVRTQGRGSLSPSSYYSASESSIGNQQESPRIAALKAVHRHRGPSLRTGRPETPGQRVARSRQDSNLRTRLRRPALYPLSYGSPRATILSTARPLPSAS